VRYNYFGNKILAAQRSENEITIKMEFPGGKVEENENNEEALLGKLKKRLMLK
jgi:8-oxo-dGTP pyrophosphatase MutT (NUDIX family)